MKRSRMKPAPRPLTLAERARLAKSPWRSEPSCNTARAVKVNREYHAVRGRK